jgi:AraC-like DNA-binding protein
MPTPVWDIAVPSGPHRLAGVTMAGFRDRNEDLVDLQVIPYPAVTMLLEFGDGLFVSDDDVAVGLESGNVAVGLGPGGVRGRGHNVECLQIRLSPAVAHAVLGDPADLGGTVVALDDLWGRDAERIQDRMRATTSWQDRFALAEAALLTRYEAGRTVDPEVAHAWWLMMTNRGQIRVERLAGEVGWSRKRLWSRFRAQIGCTPKRAAQLIRFDHAAHRLAAGHSPADVAAESGYADQSHLHRDVLTFAGVTPSAVAAAPWLAVDPVAWAAPQYAART